MSEGVIAAVITGVLSLAGILLSAWLGHAKTMATVQTAQAVTDAKIEALTREVRAHNGLIERTYDLERRADLAEEKIKVANHRIDDLEKGARE